MPKDTIYWEKIKAGKRRSFYSIPLPMMVKKGKVVQFKKPLPYAVYVEGVSKETRQNPKGVDFVVVKTMADAKKLSGLLRKLM